MPAMADGEAVFTALEHEAMHQETLLYMWRRLPVRAQAASRTTRLRARRRSAAVPAHRHSRRPRDARRAASVSARGPLGDRRGRRLRLGQRVRRARVDVPGFDIDAHSVTNAEFLRVHRRRRLSAAASCGTSRLGMARGRAGRPSGVLGRRRSGSGADGVGLARHVRGHSAAARVAGLRQPGGGCGVRALEGTPAADRGRVSSRRVRQPRWRGARVPVGRRAAAAGARQFRFPVVGAGAGRRASGGRERVGRARSRRQRLGVDRQRVRAVPRLRARCRRTRSTRPSSSTASTSC